MGKIKELLYRYIGEKALFAFCGMIFLFVLTFFMSIGRNDENWYFSLIFLFIAVVVIPVLSYLNKKGLLK